MKSFFVHLVTLMLQPFLVSSPLQTWLCSLIFKTITDHTLNHVIVLDKRVEEDRSQRNKLIFSATVL